MDEPAEGGDAPTLEQLSLWYGELKLVHKRLHDAYDATQTENKRFKTSTSNVVDELLCPITQQLPADPVTADDGRLYERAAIEEWFEKQNVVQKKGKGEVSVRSPSTNKHMGLDLTDAVQIRITIQHLVQSGLVDDDNISSCSAGVIILNKQQAVLEVFVSKFLFPSFFFGKKTLNENSHALGGPCQACCQICGRQPQSGADAH